LPTILILTPSHARTGEAKGRRGTLRGGSAKALRSQPHASESAS
jgi:hypothetical protein